MKTTTLAAALALLAVPALAGDEPMKDGKPAAVETRSKSEILADAQKQFGQADANSDGYLKGDEIVKGWLERYDADADGKISRTEFVEISTRPPKLRHLTPMRDAAARARQIVAFFDKNKDGLVQKDEYPGDQVKFREFDKNRDEVLSVAETMAMAEEEIADIRKKLKSPNRYEFLALFDADKDNNVALDEYDGPPAEFKRYDKNDDGVVSYEELYPERMAEKSRKSDKGEAMGPRPEDLSILETLDANKDGKVARDEFKGNDDAWKRLDRNGDGVVTIADAR